MKKYLLDTNVCIFLLKDQFGVAERIEEIGRENCYISEITLLELYFGAYNSGRKEQKIEGVKFIEEYFRILPIRNVFDTFGECKTSLRKQGIIIDDFDLLIGCTATYNHLIMVTENVKHLGRIENIQIENWITR